MTLEPHAIPVAIDPDGVLEGVHESGRPSEAQARWLRRGLDQPGGKLPLFDEDGQRVSDRTVRSCIDLGWAEPWFANPIKPDWLVCKLTDRGRAVLDGAR
ncbi:MAG: hypothetical protein KDE22_12070 [Rhodobacterales bacterium]|nr:hypothetical protein [Rhodobacterales bacterium]